MLRRDFIKTGLGTAAFLGCGTVAYQGVVGRHDLSVKHVPVKLGLESPLRVALMADFHFDPMYETGWLETVFQHAAAQNPDLVLYAGDYVTHTNHRFEEFGAIAATLQPPLGAYAGFGNHDHWGGVEVIARVLDGAGVRILCNEAVPLPRNPGWYLSGLDSFWSGQPSTAFLGVLPQDARLINIVHEPDAWDLASDPRFRLQVSGHTHGGQIRLPMIGAIELPKMGQRYDEGLFQRNGRALYVNRGIGTIHIPCRINCRPEVTILELT
jgi:hypothetical protein